MPVEPYYSPDPQVDLTKALQGARSIASGQLVTSEAAQQLVGTRMSRRSISIYNADDADAVCIGPSGVTAETGHLIPPGGSISVDTTKAVYVVALSGTPRVSYLESYDA